MQVSIREVLQLAERCFAAAGFSKGNARANAESIWWTEAYRGRGLTTLHTLLDGLESCDRTALTRSDRSATVPVIEGRGQPSIVASDPVLDFASARASRTGVGLAYATTAADDPSLPAIGHVAYKAAERGTVSVLVYTDGSDSGTFLGVPTDSKPLLAEAEFGAPPAGLRDVCDIVASGSHQQRHAPLMQVLFDESTGETHGVADELLVERFLQRATTSADAADATTEPGFALLCLDPRHPRRPERVQRVATQFIDDRETQFATVYSPERVCDRVETLMQEGVEVDRDVWEDVFEYNTGVLTPPFEGSKQGAGFGLSD
jgi:LDH2 family malate/lactate/ureidoglycolate dehydrogenase